MSIQQSALSRHRFLLLSGAAASLAACSGGGASPGNPAPSGVPPTATPTGTPTPVAANAVSLSIVRSKNVGAVVPTLGSLSYEKSAMYYDNFTGQNASLIGCFQRLGTSVLRIGGDTVDQTTWTPNGAGSTPGQVAPPDVDALAAFLEITGWTAIYGINLATNSPSVAAAEAAYVANALGSSLHSFEIGNEPDQYAQKGLRPATYSVAQFEAEWTSYVAAIQQSVPNASMAGPGCASNAATWTIPFASGASPAAQILTQHYGKGNSEDTAQANMTFLVTPDAHLPVELADLENAATSNSIAGGYRITECVSFYGNGVPNVSDAFGSALWAIDVMMTVASNGCSGVHFHGGGDGPGYEPIAVGTSGVVEVRPEYYGMLFVAQIAPGPMYAVNISTNLLLSAYAIAGNDGATYLVIANKEASNAAMATINLGASATSATQTLLLSNSLTSLEGETLGGSSISPSGAWQPVAPQSIAITGSTLSVQVAAASAMLLKIK